MEHGYLSGAAQEGEPGAKAGALGVVSREQGQLCLWILPPNLFPEISSSPSVVFPTPEKSPKVKKRWLACGARRRVMDRKHLS